MIRMSAHGFSIFDCRLSIADSARPACRTRPTRLTALVNRKSICWLALLALCGCALQPPEVDYSKYTSEELNDFGVVFEEAGNLWQAERAYGKALAKDPANHVAASNLANVYYQQRKFDRAASYYRKALAVSPGYVPALNNLANVQIETTDYAGAQENLQKALALAQTPEEKRAIYLSLASLNHSTGSEAESEKWIEKANAIKPLKIIAGVPFFRQNRYDCGPAALACVYNFLGVEQEPQEISSRVYSREQKGSLNLQMLIDARQQGLAATMYSGSFEHIKQAIDNEMPLILMLSDKPENEDSLHYVVVVGYEGDDLATIITHDGYEPFKRYERETLEQMWSTTGYCTIEIVTGER